MAVWILSDSEQLEICALYAPGLLTMKTLAKHYGVSSATISNVLHDHRVKRHRAVLSVTQVRLLQYLASKQIELTQLQGAFQ